MGEAKRRRAYALARIALPAKGEPLPPYGVFGPDDFFRTTYFSDVIGLYATEAERTELVGLAREKRMPGMSFADTLEAMARYLHNGGSAERLIETNKKPKEILEREMRITEIIREKTKNIRATRLEVFQAVANELRKMYPKATTQRLEGALEAGNTKDGYSVAAVIESMQLTEPVTESGG